MKKWFLYNVLQYRHSLILNESINIGILFVFHKDKVIRYIPGNLERVKLIYPNFDVAVVDKITKGILNKVVENASNYDLFDSIDNRDKLEEHQKLLRNDDSSLQFDLTKRVIYPFDNVEKIISEYTRLLLLSPVEKQFEEHKDDNYIIKKYTNFLSKGIENFDNLISKDTLIESNGIKLRFNYAWRNGTFNLVKPVSFDLKKEYKIQSKSITFFGYFTKLKDYAEKNNLRYDLLVTEPTNKDLIAEYENGLEIIKSSQARTKIVPESEWEEYSNETVFYLNKKLKELNE